MTPQLKFLNGIRDAVRPDPKVWVDEWAEQNRVLPPDTPEPGQWRNHRTPYLIDIMRTMSPGSLYREGWVMKGHQVGGSSAGENFIGASICTAAGSILVVFPTLEDAKQWEMTRFEEMRKTTKDLRRRVRDADVKGANNTKLRKKYPGGVMRLVGSNRVGALKSSTIRYVKFEEPDEYPAAIGEQGDTITLTKKRTSNFGRKAKIYGDGTPTIEDRSAIEAQCKRGDQRKWHVPCPDCGHAQTFEWERFRWEPGQPDTVLYHCVACGTGSPEHAWKGAAYAPRPPGCTEEQAAELGLAHWRATAKGEPGVASWLLPSFVAPIGWRPWNVLASDWDAAQGDEEKLKAFRNNEEGLPWRDTIRTDVGADVLQRRAESYDLMTVPQGGLVVVAGVDTQDNRLAVVVRAYGRDEESWGVWHGEIFGTPSAPETWAKLAELLSAPMKHASGQLLRIDAVAIDAGGHHGEDVYAFCRDAQARGRHWFAVRGAKAYDAPKLGRPKTIEFTWRGKAVPGGAQLRFVGTQSIKNLLDSRLSLKTAGGGYMHTPLGFGADYYKQMRSERREWKKDTRGNKALVWVKGDGVHEAWDCEVYGYAAYLYLMAGRHAETVFRNRERLLASTVQPDMFEAPPVGPPTTPEQPDQDVHDQDGQGDQDEHEEQHEEPADQSPPGADAVDISEAPPPQAAPSPRSSPAVATQPKPKRRAGFVSGWRR